MNEPSLKKPTKKTFHFPKGATAQDAAADTQADAPAEATVKVKAAAEAKASRKANGKAAAAPKAKAAPKEKAAPKQKAAPKEKAVEADVAAEKPKRDKKDTAKKEAVKKEVVKKEKVVRDSFTMPKSDYAKIAALKQKCLDAGISVKKSEILRAGLLLLEGATPQRLLAAISAVETVKTGRPSKE